MKTLFKTTGVICIMLSIFQMAASQTMYKIDASNPNIQYTGRIDNSNPDNVAFSFPGVSIKAKFQGTAIDAILKESGSGGTTTTNYFNIIIDGGTPTKIALSRTQTVYQLARNLTNGEHTVELFKLTESQVGKVEFQGFQLETGKILLTPAPLPTRKIEFIGNSITCGYGNELTTNDPDSYHFTSVNENNYKAWGAITARNLNAQYVAVSYSGRGMYRNNTNSTTGTLPLIYDQIHGDYATPTWDHTQYTPNVVVINLGTNDFAQGVVDRTSFVNTYTNFLTKLRGYYPNATFVCVVGVMMSDYYPAGNCWTKIQEHVKAVVDAKNAAGDTKVHYLMIEPQQTSDGYGEDWHPTAATHQRMATKLTTFINTLPASTWDNPTPPVGVVKGKIAHWELNKKAAIVFTFDDWSSSHNAFVVPQLKQRNLNATFFLVSSNIPNWANVRTAAADGNEMANHTTDHTYAQTQADYVSKVLAAKTAIETNVPAQKVYTFAYPNGSLDNNLINYLKSTGHIASRAVTPPTTYGYNFAPTENDYHKIATISMGSATSNTTATFTNYINNMINGGGLLTFLYHGVGSDGGYSPVTQADLQAQLDVAVSLQNKIWVTTLANAIKYHREANCASLTEVEAPANNKWVVNLTDTLSNNTTYNYPLTLMLKMNGVNYNTITQNGNPIAVDAIFNDTIMFRAIPDGGDITLEISGIRMQMNISPNSIQNAEATQIEVTANVIAEAPAAISSVTIDLSEIEGGAAVAMTANGNNSYRIGYQVPAGLTAGNKTITVIATDNMGNSQQVKTFLRITQAQEPPSNESSIIADNEDDNFTKLGTPWYSFNDRNDGGLSTVSPLSSETSPFTMTAGGANGTDNAVKITYTLNKGSLGQYVNPYVGVGFNLNATTNPLTPYDLTGSTGITFWHKGSEVTVYIGLSTITNYDNYGSAIPAHDEWTRVTIPWENFNQAGWSGVWVEFDASQITQIQWQVSSVTGATGEVWIDEVQIDGIDLGFGGENTFIPAPADNKTVVFPSQDQIFISSGKQISAVSIINCTGSIITIQKVQNTSVTLPIAGLERGIYLIRIVYAGNSSETVKFIKQE